MAYDKQEAKRILAALAEEVNPSGSKEAKEKAAISLLEALLELKSEPALAEFKISGTPENGMGAALS